MLSTSEVSRLVADEYALKPTGTELIGSGHNDSYAVETDRARYAVRVYGEGKPWIKGPEDLRFELDLLTHLRARGAPVSYPIQRRSGDSLGTRSSPTGDRHYALFSWCPRRPIGTTDLTLEQAARLGVAIARIHVASDSFVTRYSRYVLDAVLLVEQSLERMSPALDLASPDDLDFSETRAAQIGAQLRAFVAGPGE